MSVTPNAKSHTEPFGHFYRQRKMSQFKPNSTGKESFMKEASSSDYSPQLKEETRITKPKLPLNALLQSENEGSQIAGSLVSFDNTKAEREIEMGTLTRIKETSSFAPSAVAKRNEGLLKLKVARIGSTTGMPIEAASSGEVIYANASHFSKENEKAKAADDTRSLRVQSPQTQHQSSFQDYLIPRTLALDQADLDSSKKEDVQVEKIEISNNVSIEEAKQIMNKLMSSPPSTFAFKSPSLQTMKSIEALYQELKDAQVQMSCLLNQLAQAPKDSGYFVNLYSLASLSIQRQTSIKQEVDWTVMRMLGASGLGVMLSLFLMLISISVAFDLWAIVFLSVSVCIQILFIILMKKRLSAAAARAISSEDEDALLVIWPSSLSIAQYFFLLMGSTVWLSPFKLTALMENSIIVKYSMGLLQALQAMTSLAFLLTFAPQFSIKIPIVYIVMFILLQAYQEWIYLNVDLNYEPGAEIVATLRCFLLLAAQLILYFAFARQQKFLEIDSLFWEAKETTLKKESESKIIERPSTPSSPMVNAGHHSPDFRKPTSRSSQLHQSSKFRKQAPSHSSDESVSLSDDDETEFEIRDPRQLWPFEQLLTASILVQFQIKSAQEQSYQKRINLYNHQSTNHQGSRILVKAITPDFFERIPAEVNRFQRSSIGEENHRFTFNDSAKRKQSEQTEVAINFDPMVFRAMSGESIRVAHEPLRNISTVYGSTRELHRLGTQTNSSKFKFREPSEKRLEPFNPTALAEQYELEKDKLYQKIFEPYYITNTTIYLFKTRFQDIQSEQRLSIMEIWEIFHQSKFRFSQCKVYFRVDSNEREKDVGSPVSPAQRFSIQKTPPIPNLDQRRGSRIGMRRNSEMHLSNPSYENSGGPLESGGDIKSQTNISKSLDFSEENFRIGTRSDEKIIEEEENSSYQSHSRPGKFQDQVMQFKNSILGLPTADNDLNAHHDQPLISSSMSDSSIDKTEDDVTTFHDINTTMKQHYKNYQNRERAKGPGEDDGIRYFEFEFKQVQRNGQPQVLFSIRELTSMLSKLRQRHDRIYLDAIETNYSHEQMTPLNGLINSSRVVRKKLTQIKNEINRLSEQHNHPLARVSSQLSLISSPTMSKISGTPIQVLGDQVQTFIKTIEQTALQFYYHNLNQLTRINIRRNKVQLSPVSVLKPETFVEEVLDIFEQKITESQLGVFIGRCNNFGPINIKTDWTIYKQILYNLVQNAVKFNCRKGDIMVLLRCLPKSKDDEAKEHEGLEIRRRFDLQSAYSSMKFDQVKNTTSPQTLNTMRKGSSVIAFEEDKFMLETIIIDTGNGISKTRQSQLFVLFSELRKETSIMKVKDFNIGLGLTCSHDITEYMKGDIKLKQSERGLTVFGFKYPVQVEKQADAALEDKKGPQLTQIFGEREDFSPQIRAYLEKKKIKDAEIVPRKSTVSPKMAPEKKSSSFISFDQKKSTFRESFQFMKKSSKMYRQENDPLQIEFDKLIKMPSDQTPSDSERKEEDEEDEGSDPEVGSSNVQQEHEQLVKLVPPLKLQRLEEEPDREKKKGMVALIMLQNKMGWRNMSGHSTPVVSSHDGVKRSKLEDETVFDLQIGKDQVWQQDSEPESLNDIILLSAKPPQREKKEEEEQEQDHPVEKSGFRDNESSSVNMLESPSVISSIRHELLHSECGCQPQILIVDDTSFNLLMATTMLDEEFGIKADTATNGLEAFEKYKACYSEQPACLHRAYSLIIMDIQMPIMDGLQSSLKIGQFLATKAIKETENISDKQVKTERLQELKDLTHIVGLSSFTNKKEICLANGMKDLYNKPLKVEDLYVIVHKHLLRSSRETLAAAFLKRFGEEKAQQRGLL